MKKLAYFVILLIIISPVFCVQKVFAETAGHLLISEVASGINSSADNEFVEIYNPTDAPITINSSNFKLKLVDSSDNASSKRIAWTNNTILAHGYFLFTAGSVVASPDATFSPQLSSTSGVIITDGSGVVIDVMSPEDAAEYLRKPERKE